MHCTERQVGPVDERHCDPLGRPDDRQRPCSEEPCPARCAHPDRCPLQAPGPATDPTSRGHGGSRGSGRPHPTLGQPRTSLATWVWVPPGSPRDVLLAGLQGLAALGSCPLGCDLTRWDPERRAPLTRPVCPQVVGRGVAGLLPLLRAQGPRPPRRALHPQRRAGRAEGPAAACLPAPPPAPCREPLQPRGALSRHLGCGELVSGECWDGAPSRPHRRSSGSPRRQAPRAEGGRGRPGSRPGPQGLRGQDAPVSHPRTPRSPAG